MKKKEGGATPVVCVDEELSINWHYKAYIYSKCIYWGRELLLRNNTPTQLLN